MAIKDLEVNDVDISNLFHWKKKASIVLETQSEPMEVYMRLVGDAEINRARIFALRRSAELRKKLKDEDSDEYFAFLYDSEDFEEEQLISFLILEESRDLYTRIIKDIDFKKPKELPSDASLEDQEKYQEEIDSYPQRLHEHVSEKVKKEVQNLEDNYRNKSRADLYKLYKKSAINSLCEAEMYSMFKAMCTFFGTFKDEEMKERLFSSFEEFENVPTKVKHQLLSEYDSLEITIDKLKK